MRRIITTIALTAAISLTAHGEYVTPPEGLRLRKSPSLEAEIIEVLPFETEVTGIINDGWMKTENGYLSAEYLNETNPLNEAQFLGTWRVTAYAATGNMTASGTWPEIGRTLATNDLPFGSLVYVSGNGIWCVEDRGPEYMGSEWCDLFLGDIGDCIAWGDQRLDIYLLQ